LCYGDFATVDYARNARNGDIHVRHSVFFKSFTRVSAMTCLPKPRHFALLTSLLALQIVVGACLPYRKGSFKGPAAVADTGVFSYYRYHFLFHPKLSLRQKGGQTYRFRGVPSDEMTVSFAVVPFNASEVNLLKSITTVLSVELRGEKDNLVCSASGPLSESLRGTSVKDEHGKWTDSHWVLGPGNFWNAACTDIKMEHHRAYVLKVKLDQIDPRTPDKMLEPRIEGGGNEVP
jgi:hypothetical protein